MSYPDLALPSPRLTHREKVRVRRWLDRHGARGQAPAPLLAARLAARNRASRFEVAALVIVVAGLLGWRTWQLATGADNPSTASTLALLVVAFPILFGGSLVALRRRRHAEEKIGADLPHRVARPAAVSLPRLLGPSFLIAAGVTFGGGLVVGITAALAGEPSDRLVAAAFLLAVVVLAGLGMATLTDLHRRPAVADSEPSLVDDDVLRREDAHRTLTTPYLVMFAYIAAVHSMSGDALMVAYLGYAVVATVAWAVAWGLVSYAPAGAAQLPAATS